MAIGSGLRPGGMLFNGPVPATRGRKARAGQAPVRHALRKFGFRAATGAAARVLRPSRGRAAARQATTRAARLGGLPDVGAALNLRARMAWCSELLAFRAAPSDGLAPGRSGRLADKPEVRCCTVAGGGAGRSADYTAVRAGQAKAARRPSTDTRQPCARGSRSDGWPAHRAFAEYKPQRETLRRARLYGCSTRDPLLRKIRRKKPAPPPLPEKPPPPEPAPADLHERLFAPPPENRTAAHSRTGGSFLRARRGAAR